MSPPCAWARHTDRLAFAYNEDGVYNVYGGHNPGSLRRQPYQDSPTPPVTSLLAVARRDTARASATPAGAAMPTQQSPGATSRYRPPTRFPAPSATPQRTDSPARPTPVNVRPPAAPTTALP